MGSQSHAWPQSQSRPHSQTGGRQEAKACGDRRAKAGEAGEVEDVEAWGPWQVKRHVGASGVVEAYGIVEAWVLQRHGYCRGMETADTTGELTLWVRIGHCWVHVSVHVPFVQLCTIVNIVGTDRALLEGALTNMLGF